MILGLLYRLFPKTRPALDGIGKVLFWTVGIPLLVVMTVGFVLAMTSTPHVPTAAEHDAAVAEMKAACIKIDTQLYPELSALEIDFRCTTGATK